MDEIQFGARTLNLYAEPVDTFQLTEGECYFSLNYVDEDMLIPMLETMVFIGKFLDNRGVNCLRFQEIDSYREGVRHKTATTDADVQFFECAEEHAKNIFEFEKALEELMLCSMRRRGELGSGC